MPEPVDCIYADEIEVGYSLSERGIIILRINGNINLAFDPVATVGLLTGFAQTMQDAERQFRAVDNMIKEAKDAEVEE